MICITFQMSCTKLQESYLNYPQHFQFSFSFSVFILNIPINFLSTPLNSDSLKFPILPTTNSKFRVAILFNFKSDSFFNPFVEFTFKIMSFNPTSFKFVVIKATVTSSLPENYTKAGRNLLSDKSVNGNETKMISPFVIGISPSNPPMYINFLLPSKIQNSWIVKSTFECLYLKYNLHIFDTNIQ